jgi:hypothetical protein
MEPEPIPARPRPAATLEPAEMNALRHVFVTMHLPAFQRALRLHDTGTKVRVLGWILMLFAVGAGFVACNETRGGSARWASLIPTAGGFIAGYLVYAFGAYLSACAEHHRSSLLNAIMNCPHHTPEKALELLREIEKKIAASHF